MSKVAINQRKRGSALNLILSFMCQDSVISGHITEPIGANDLAMLRFHLYCDYANKLVCSVSVKKNETAKNSIVKVNIFCNKDNNQITCLDNWSEYKELARISSNYEDKQYDNKKCVMCSSKNYHLFTLEVNIIVEEVTNALRTNEGLYDDKQFTDLELCSPDGSVAVHRVILANHSELVRSLLGEQSRETGGKLPIQGATVQTLQHLKDYMYLGTLPIVGLPQLLLLAIHGKMAQLKADCIMKLATVVTADDLDSLIDFAIQNNIPELVRAMLSLTSDNAVDGAHQNRKNKLKFCTLNLTQLALE